MLTIEEVKKMDKKELNKIESELLYKMEVFVQIPNYENLEHYKEIYNDYVLVSDEIERITEEEFTEEDWAEIHAIEKRMMEAIYRKKHS